MEKISISIKAIFIATTLITVWQFYNATGKSKTVIIGLMSYMLIQAAIGMSGFYQTTNTMPPRFALQLAPGVICILMLFFTTKGQDFIARLDIKKLTLLHTIRIPVEFVLYFIYVAGLIPVLMTFEGWNFDIVSGLSASMVYYFVFVSKQVGNKVLLAWNIICLGLLINIVIIAILSAPTPFQQLAFDQPNIGIFYFPFLWLPSVLVPIVLLSHLVSIKQLIFGLKK